MGRLYFRLSGYPDACLGFAPILGNTKRHRGEQDGEPDLTNTLSGLSSNLSDHPIYLTPAPTSRSAHHDKRRVQIDDADGFLRHDPRCHKGRVIGCGKVAWRDLSCVSDTVRENVGPTLMGRLRQ